jgi:dephospho-CoA kinase
VSGPSKSSTSPDRRALRIGLTGPIGCGKSTVAGWLAERGARVIDADRIAREVVEPGRPAFEAVVAAFGRDVVGADGALDRPALAARVFQDPDALSRLEAIVHPAVRPEILEQVHAADAADVPVVVIEAIKLVEGGLASICDEVWLVACEPDEQRRRLLGRGMTRDDAERRIRSQGDLAARLAPVATRVVDTDGTVETARERVFDLLEAALEARSARDT